VTEAPRLSAENVPPSGRVVVKDVDGQIVEIPSFDRVAVAYEWCSPDAKFFEQACSTRREVFGAPVRFTFDETNALVVTSAATHRARVTLPARFTDAEYLRVSRSTSWRPLVIVGAAVASCAAVAVPTYTAYQKRESGPDDWGGIIVPYFGCMGGAGLSVAITIPLTSSLGSVVDTAESAP
jgi:hypothetical protein